MTKKEKELKRFYCYYLYLAFLLLGLDYLDGVC